MYLLWSLSFEDLHDCKKIGLLWKRTQKQKPDQIIHIWLSISVQRLHSILLTCSQRCGVFQKDKYVACAFRKIYSAKVCNVI